MNRSASLKRRIANLEAQIAEAEELLASQEEHQAHNMFDEYDTNLDSLIDDSEWGGSQPVFDALDVDQNVYLDPSEIEMGFGSSFSKLANANRFKGFARKKLAHSMFEEFDTNLDGLIDQSEWGGSPEAFNALDLDGDGMLSPDEINMGVGSSFGKLASSRKRASDRYLSSEEIANILGGKVISKRNRRF
jgi:Ca2+-binding EF-hand superfamily protein